jgi:hypothetical protein
MTAPMCVVVGTKSAVAVTTMACVAVLLAEAMSVVAEPTVTELVTLPMTFEAMLTAMTRDLLAPLAMPVALVHDTVVVPVQVQPEVAVPASVKPAGSVSVTVMGPAASDGPLLVIVRSNDVTEPATGVPM